MLGRVIRLNPTRDLIQALARLVIPAPQFLGLSIAHPSIFYVYLSDDISCFITDIPPVAIWAQLLCLDRY